MHGACTIGLILYMPIVIKSSIFPVFYNTATQNAAFNGDVVEFFSALKL